MKIVKVIDGRHCVTVEFDEALLGGTLVTAAIMDVRLLERESGHPVPEGEPLYLLRGRNMLAVTVLQMYRDLLAGIEGLDVDLKGAVISELADILAKFEKFETENPDALSELV